MPATTTLRIRVVMALAAACILSGCGGGKDESIAPPPPAPKPVAGVGPAGNTAITPAPGAPTTDAGAPPPAGQGTPPAAPAGPEDLFRGMTPKQIDDFKKNATPETHDLNIGRVKEAADGFFKEYGRYAANQEQLVKAGYLPSVLPAPKGKKYVFDPKSVEVTVENK